MKVLAWGHFLIYDKLLQLCATLFVPRARYVMPTDKFKWQYNSSCNNIYLNIATYKVGGNITSTDATNDFVDAI
jgi:hypothetical protein